MPTWKTPRTNGLAGIYAITARLWRVDYCLQEKVPARMNLRVIVRGPPSRSISLVAHKGNSTLAKDRKKVFPAMALSE
jgi:hypothetical protein